MWCNAWSRSVWLPERTETCFYSFNGVRIQSFLKRSALRLRHNRCDGDRSWELLWLLVWNVYWFPDRSILDTSSPSYSRGCGYEPSQNHGGGVLRHIFEFTLALLSNSWRLFCIRINIFNFLTTKYIEINQFNFLTAKYIEINRFNFLTAKYIEVVLIFLICPLNINMFVKFTFNIRRSQKPVTVNPAVS